MDPITIITSALIAGAAASVKGVVAQAVKDGYAGLKALVVRKFGKETDVEDALEGVEKKPDSEARQAVLKEELEVAGVGQDAEVIQQAQALLDLLKQHAAATSTTYKAALKGSGAIAQGESAAAAGAGGVAVGGSVTGSTIITGDGNVVGDHSRSDVRISGGEKDK
jgi:hypothetical protein